MNRISETLTVSKIERNVLRFTVLYVRKYEEQIQVSIEEYYNSLKELNDIRKANKNDNLTKLEMKEYQKVTGKLSGLAQGMRKDLSFTVLHMSKKNNAATVADLWNVNKQPSP